MASSAPLRSVLIVEDDRDLRELLVQLMTVEGLAVTAVDNGRRALEQLSGIERPGVILLDLMMPVLDGFEFLRLQRADATLRAIPVIVLSALPRDRLVEFDGVAFLEKPVDFDRLLEQVRRYCE
jgi:CheY-like chemotaxis protein